MTDLNEEGGVTSFICTSARSSQYVIPISWHIVVAVVSDLHRRGPAALPELP